MSEILKTFFKITLKCTRGWDLKVTLVKMFLILKNEFIDAKTSIKNLS